MNTMVNLILPSQTKLFPRTFLFHEKRRSLAATLPNTHGIRVNVVLWQGHLILVVGCHVIALATVDGLKFLLKGLPINTAV